MRVLQNVLMFLPRDKKGATAVEYGLMVALIAVARKLLTSINAIVRDQKPWDLAFT